MYDFNLVKKNSKKFTMMEEKLIRNFEGRRVYIFKTVEFPHEVLVKITNASYIDECENSLLMDKLKIGPKIYETIIITKKTRTIQIIIMKLYDGDLEKFLLADNSMILKIKSVKKMLYLIKKQARNGVFCIDIKPNNYVYKLEGDELEIKMIDFDLCYKKIEYFRKLSADRKIQADFFCVVMFVQLLIFVVKFVGFSEKIIRIFYEEKLLKKYYDEPKKLSKILRTFLKYGDDCFMFDCYKNGNVKKIENLFIEIARFYA